MKFLGEERVRWYTYDELKAEKLLHVIARMIPLEKSRKLEFARASKEGTAHGRAVRVCLEQQEKTSLMMVRKDLSRKERVCIRGKCCV